jgi:2-oxoglutarate ferredoxin oxidoreductase subunit delta
MSEVFPVPKVTIREDDCKGCGLCAVSCPKKILKLSDRLNMKGYHPVECEKPEACIGCAFCARMCPDCVITVEK